MNKVVAIIIVNWNGKQYLKDCLDAVYAQSMEFTLFFVDNGSSDGSVDFVKYHYPNTEIISLDKNTGFTGGNNVALKRVMLEGYKYVVLLNNDTIVHKGWLDGLVKAISLDSKVAAVGSKSLFPEGDIQTIGLSFDRGFHGGDDGGGKSIGYGLPGDSFGELVEIFAPCAVSAIYKVEALRQVGIFDDLFFAYGEDFDLGLRLRLAGWRSYCNPDSTLTHFHSRSSGAASEFKAFHTKRNSFFVAFKNLPLEDLVFFFWMEVSWVFRSIFLKSNKSVEKLAAKSGLSAVAKVYLRALFSFMVNLPAMLGRRFHVQKNLRVVGRTELKKWYDEYSRKNIEEKYA